MVDLRTRATLAVAALVVALCALATASAPAAPVTVNLRVEGKDATLIEQPVTTDAKNLNKDASGSHPCDGTNGGASATPGPTMTSALDDGTIATGLTWAGTWFDGFDDFGIDRVGPDSSTSSAFWGYALNFTPTQVGGCQQKVVSGDDVLFAYDFFSKSHLLKLVAPATAEAGRPVTVTVTDGQDGSKVAGASVGGALTGADGTAQVTFSQPGTQRLKAERADSVRSNLALVCVHGGNDGSCGTQAPVPGGGGSDVPVVDRSPAIAKVTSVKNGRRYARGRGPRLLKGTADSGGAGIRSIRIRLLRQSGKRCAYYSVKTERFRRGACAATWFFYTIGDRPQWEYLLPARLGAGLYTLDVVVVDRLGHRIDTVVRFEVAGRR
jgi:hypothetical protein